MQKVSSNDGSAIAFDHIGNGPSVVLVDGALCAREFGPSAPLAALLSPHFTVFTYDRRGRGHSGNTSKYAIEREIEDLQSLIGTAGGSAFVYGISSGAVLALEAANRGLAIRKLALYEAPFIVDDTRLPIPGDFLAQLDRLLSENRRGDAVKLFLKLAGAPSMSIAVMQFLPMWKRLESVAHTLPHDITIVQDHQRGKPLSAARWARVTMPTLVLDGGKSPTWMRHGMQSLSTVLPNATHRTLEGQAHMVKPRRLAPMLTEFFSA